MVSILMLTWNRYEITKQCIEHNLNNSGLADYELLIADQGSSDMRLLKAFLDWKPEYLRLNRQNEGCSKSFNQLYLRSVGHYIAILGNDILMPDGWGKKAVEQLDKIPNAGLCGYDWGHACTPPLSQKLGFELHWLTPQLNRVFGSCVFKREVVETIGFFHEGYDVYGIEDSDFNERVNLAGFNSFYLPNMHSRHLGVGEHDTGDYREMKNQSLSKNVGIFGERLQRFHVDGIVEPLPPHRDPL